MARPEIRDLDRFLAAARARFLYGLDRTPDDRLTWSPGGSARSALQTAGRVAMFLGFASHLLKEGTMPERPASMPPGPASREEAKAAVDAAFARARQTVASLTEPDLDRTFTPPWGGTATIAQMLWWLPSAIGYYQGQLNMLQLAWGDEDPNIPPDWGREQG